MVLWGASCGDRGHLSDTSSQRTGLITLRVITQDPPSLPTAMYNKAADNLRNEREQKERRLFVDWSFFSACLGRNGLSCVDLEVWRFNNSVRCSLMCVICVLVAAVVAGTSLVEILAAPRRRRRRRWPALTCETATGGLLALLVHVYRLSLN